MKGLILKDIIVLKNKLKLFPFILLGILAFIVIYFLNATGVLVINILLPIFLCSMPIPLFLEDDKANWDTYILSTPLSKMKIILSRYITSFIIIFITLLLLILFNLLYSYFFAAFSLSIHMITIYSTFFISTIYLSLLLPSVYYNGAQGGSIAILAFILICSGLNYLNGVIKVNAFLTVNPVYLISISIAIMTISILVSLYTSHKIYSKKNQ